MKVGIVGLPNVGKSTLFKALTKSSVDINNYPFCTIKPNVGVARVPDDRLEKLSLMSRSKKTIPAVVEFSDIAGLVKGASLGEGLGNAFLANIREVDAIVHVVRVFENEAITHVHDSVDPERDIEVVHTELILADLETIRRRKDRLAKEVRAGDKKAIVKMNAIEMLETSLNEGKLAREVALDRDDETVQETLRELFLLTEKPMFFAYNVNDASAPLASLLEVHPHVKLDVKIEEELIDLSSQEAEELGLRSTLDDLIVQAYKILGLITFFTTGEDESRAWTIKRGWTAPEAGTAIHNDFKDKFIRAEIVAWDKLLEAGSWARARELGTLRTEGKEYEVQDGDVIIFKI